MAVPSYPSRYIFTFHKKQCNLIKIRRNIIFIVGIRAKTVIVVIDKAKKKPIKMLFVPFQFESCVYCLENQLSLN